MSEVYRVGMIGVGRMGTTHARGYKFHPRTEVVAAIDTDAENLALFCDRFGVPGYTDLRQMLRNEDVDIAAPVLPVRANVETVLGCMEEEVKAVFCEKPFAATLSDADQMVECSQNRNIRFSVGYVQRNYPQFWRARDIIDSGWLGAPLYVDLYHNLNQIGCQWLPVVNLFTHDSDVEFVVGEVEGDAFSDEQAVMKGVGGLIRYSNGMHCYAHYRSGAKRGLDVVCERGVFTYDGHSFRLFVMSDDGDDMLVEEKPKVLEVTRERTDSFDEEGWLLPTQLTLDAHVQSIVDSLDHGIEPRASGADMLRAMETTIALRESARREHLPVNLPLDDRGLTVKPIPKRWDYKKELRGREWYMEQLANHKR